MNTFDTNLIISPIRVLGWLASILVSAAIGTADLSTGLVAHYDCEAGSGGVVPDISGAGNDGRIVGGVTWVRNAHGGILAFNGQDGYVDCGPNASLNIADGGTIMVWAKPVIAQGGLVSWVADTSHAGVRLMLAVDTHQGGRQTIGLMADGSIGRGFRGFETLPPGEWTHVAVTFDGKRIVSYWNGVATATIPQPLRPALEDVPMTIGRSLGLGQPYFYGELDDVRVYGRTLSAAEIRAYYQADAPARGHDLSRFSQPVAEVIPYAAAGKIVVTVNVRAMQPLDPRTSIRVRLRGKKLFRDTRIGNVPPDNEGEVVLDARNLAAGEYEMLINLADVRGAPRGGAVSTRFNWAGRPASFRSIKVLNNLVWELVNEKNYEDRVAFSLPMDRWVLVRSTASAPATLAVDDEDDVIRHAKDHRTTLEAMRYLRAGDHVVVMSEKVDRLLVRAIPALQYAFYGADPEIEPFGPYDWDFLSQHMTPHMNVMLAGLDHYVRDKAAACRHLEEWTAAGKQWLSYKAIPWNKESADEVYEYWANTTGFQHPLVDGIVIDEANGGDLESYGYFAAAVQRLNANPRFRGKSVHVRCDALYGNDRSTEFARVCLAGGGYLCWERYFGEERTAKAMRESLRRYMAAPMVKWERVFPGVTRRMVMAFGSMSEPPENMNFLPTVDHRVCMDMQMQYLATHPAFFGIGGIQWYHNGHAGEETVRCIGRLYRHYAIDGKAEPMIVSPFNLGHIVNPDFGDGTKGWTLMPAAADSLQVKTYKNYGDRVQGRFFGGIGDRVIRPQGIGDMFLLARRNAAAPNVFMQEIRNLERGRFYSMKMMTADYQDLLEGRSSKALHAVSIRLAGVTVLPGAKNNFQFPIRQARAIGKFDWKHRFYSNYHWRVFRAAGTSAELTVTDWGGDFFPGGPAGQELMFSFIEIQPYLELED